MANMALKEFILSDENIAFAIHTVKSYIQNKALLEDNDRELLSKLNDMYNVELISDVPLRRGKKAE